MSQWTWDPHLPCEPPTASGTGVGEPVSCPIPVHPLLWHPVRTRIDADRAPTGRVIGVEYTYDYQPSDPAFQKALGPRDVVWIPLFDGTIPNPAQEFKRRLPEYDANVRAIAEIAPRVNAVLCGNANAEIRFAGCTRQEEHAKCMTFIETHSKFISEFGRPCFAPVFEILVHDCYAAEGVLRDLLVEHQALTLSFAGCSWLFEQEGNHPRIPEPKPYPTLQAYLQSLDAWSGVGKMQGLRAGSAATLREMGFAAGFVGWF
jgi:hypothetical protein